MTLTSSLAGRSVVVTGASGGLGMRLVELFLEHGAHVVATDRAEPTVRLQELAGADGGVVNITDDIGSPQGAAAVVGETVRRFGSIDVLVNNAGGGIIRPFLAHDEESMRETVLRNLWTAVHCCHAALPHMVAAGWGRIINIGAESVRNGLFNHAMYNAAKGGVHGLTTGLAREFAASGITVNVVAPAGILTPAIAARTGPAWEEFRDRVLTTIPMARLADATEVAALVVFLATDDAGYITGQTISVNGGSSML